MDGLNDELLGHYVQFHVDAVDCEEGDEVLMCVTV